MDLEFMRSEWLRFFHVDAPLVCQSTIVSDDFGTTCRLEHTHFMSDHHAGHYHEDITPDIIEYEGYFVLCESLFVIRN